MKKAYDHISDPVLIGRSYTGKQLVLQIGESRRGECRYTILTPTDARVVAYSLLAEAERTDAEVKAERKKLAGQTRAA